VLVRAFLLACTDSAQHATNSACANHHAVKGVCSGCYTPPVCAGSNGSNSAAAEAVDDDKQADVDARKAEVQAWIAKYREKQLVKA
jgi:hypothetical protein